MSIRLLSVSTHLNVKPTGPGPLPVPSTTGKELRAASWLCDLCGHTGPCTPKSPILGLMFCCYRPKISFFFFFF